MQPFVETLCFLSGDHLYVWYGRLSLRDIVIDDSLQLVNIEEMNTG